MHQPLPPHDTDGLSHSMLQLSINDDEPRNPSSPFPFFDLPSELRIRIYELALLTPDGIVDLEPTNYRRIAPRLRCLTVCKQMHDEASRVFYGLQTFRLFPVHGRFFHTKLPLLARLPARYRAAVTSMELRLGPGWGSPPRCQKVDERLGLQDCTALRTLRIFVEVDPSQDIFNGFRGRGMGKDSYKAFCIALLREILDQAPSIAAVELDAYPSVGKDSPLIMALMREVTASEKRLMWGPLRGWDQAEDCGQLGLENALAGMRL